MTLDLLPGLLDQPTDLTGLICTIPYEMPGTLALLAACWSVQDAFPGFTKEVV